jgi:hypothetical protein
LFCWTAAQTGTVSKVLDFSEAALKTETAGSWGECVSDKKIRIQVAYAKVASDCDCTHHTSCNMCCLASPSVNGLALTVFLRN